MTSGRGIVPDLLMPRPIGEQLPAIFQEDDLVMRLVSAFDSVLAPAVSSLDNLPAYLDPALTPDDFLDWLAGWVGVLLDETWPIERRRAFVAVAADLYRTRGTATGLADQVRLFTAGEVEIQETGGSAWSPTPGGGVPGTPDLALVVRVTPSRGAPVDAIRLDALVAAAKPAHIVHRVEVVGR